MTRFTTLVAALAIAALAAAPVALAESVAYVAADGNVHIVTPDGARDKPVSTDATADNKYRSLSQLDDGRIVGLRKADGSTAMAFFLDRDTGQALDAWLLPKSGVGGFSPFTGAHASPDGGVIVYDYRHFDCATNPCSSGQRVGFSAGPGQTSPCLINCHNGYLAPRWMPGTAYAAMVDDGFDAVYFQKQGSASPVGWFQYGGDISIYGFDIRGGRIVTQVAVGDNEYMVVEKMNGPAPALPSSQCSVSMPDDAKPRLSPDGSKIAWSAPEGVMVSPTPTTSGGTEALCALNPTLIAPGGSQPAWGIADVPLPPEEPKEEEPKQEDPKKDPPKKDNGGKKDEGKAADKPTEVNLSGGGPAVAPLSKALAGGLLVTYRCATACRAKALATIPGPLAKRYGLGNGTAKVGAGAASLAKAGGGKVRVAFTANARAKLADATSVPVTVTLTLKGPKGQKKTRSKVVTLR